MPPTRDWVYGIDVSFDHISAEDAKLLRLAGVQVAVQCLWTGIVQPPYRVINLRNFINAGIEVAGYISINRVNPGRQHVSSGLGGVPEDIQQRLNQVFVDVELEGITAANIDSAGDAVEAAGWRRAMYTSYFMWNSVVHPSLRGSSEFAHWLLWNANWDGDPDIDFTRLPFGGWRMENVIGEQWSGGTHVPGAFADRNQFDAAYFGLAVPTPPPVEPQPTPPRPPTDAQYLHSAAVMAQVTEMFANRDHLFQGEGAQELRRQAIFLLRGRLP